MDVWLLGIYYSISCFKIEIKRELYTSLTGRNNVFNKMKIKIKKNITLKRHRRAHGTFKKMNITAKWKYFYLLYNLITFFFLRRPIHKYIEMPRRWARSNIAPREQTLISRYKLKAYYVVIFFYCTNTCVSNWRLIISLKERKWYKKYSFFSLYRCFFFSFSLFYKLSIVMNAINWTGFQQVFK